MPRSGLNEAAQVEWGNHARRRMTDSSRQIHIGRGHGFGTCKRPHSIRRKRVFCASLADVFDNQVEPAWREDLFSLIRDCDHLDWQLSTQRPQNILKMARVWDAATGAVIAVLSGHEYRVRSAAFSPDGARV
jgi:protein gp37